MAREGVPERRGTLFDYVLAGDGVWLQTENERLRARVPVAMGRVRGLEPLGGVLELEHGKDTAASVGGGGAAPVRGGRGVPRVPER